MTITSIKITTMKDIYEEKCYSLLETVDRLEELVNCDNVVALEVMDTTTGEILYYLYLYPTEKIYVSETLVVGIAKEILD